MNIDFCPSSSDLTLVASVLAITSGINERERNSNSSSSIARITAAIGVLNVAAMPAPAPHASSTLRSDAVVEINLPHQRPHRAARLNDRPFRAKRSAGADGNRRRYRFQNRHFRLDPAPRSEHRFHRFRNSVPFDFRRAVFRHEADDDPADHWHHDDP